MGANIPQRLPIPGQDNGIWGTILNDFLEVSLNTDGTLQPGALANAGAVTSINGASPANGAITLTANSIGALPTTTKLANLADTSGAAEASNNQVLTYNSTTNQWVASTVSASVSSVFGRTGAVTAQSGDYTASQVGALPIAGGTMQGALNLAIVTLTDAATIAVNAALGNEFRVTLGSNRTLGNPTSPTDGQAITLEIIQDSTGSRTLAFGTAYAFPASIPSPTLSSAPGDRDFIAFRYDAGTSLWYCTGFVPDQNAGLVTIAQGGTGQTSQQNAINALAGAQTTGDYLRGNGTNVVMSSIQATDLPYDTTASHIVTLGTQTAGSNAKPADSGHIHPAYDTMPSDHGLLAWTFSPDSTANGLALIAGSVYLVKLFVRYNFTASNAWVNVTSATSGASSGSYVGMYNSSGTLLSGSADLGTPLAVGSHEVALTTPQSLTAGTFVWISIVVNYATTQPSVHSKVTYTGESLSNINLTAANYRIAVNGTGQTSLPASITPSSNSSTGALFWFGIS